MKAFRRTILATAAASLGIIAALQSANAGLWFPIPDPNGASIPNNPQDLANANPTTEAAWLSQLLAPVVITVPQNFISKNEINADIDGGTLLDQFIPDNTVYVALKQAQLTYGFFCSGGSCGDLVYQGQLGLGTDLSHATFFTPIPAAWLLFGSAFAGLWGIRRWRAQPVEAAAAA